MCIRDRAPGLADARQCLDIEKLTVAENIPHANQKINPKRCNAIDPVSYTHLDVYKRQRWKPSCGTATARRVMPIVQP